MCCKKKKLIAGKRIRTYLKRLVTILSTALLIVYVAALVFNISGFSLHFAIAGTILSAISFALNAWSLTYHSRKHDAHKETGIVNTPKKKATKNLFRYCI